LEWQPYAWGRNLNCGQQCIAPEYVLCHRSVLDEFTKQLRHWTRELYPDPFAEGAMVGAVYKLNAADPEL
jgi:acyl-CoA reductase-like NAD-dependent aldehyde dehydrogenase